MLVFSPASRQISPMIHRRVGRSDRPLWKKPTLSCALLCRAPSTIVVSGESLHRWILQT